MKYDFSGRAATEGVRCTDGSTFLPGSLKSNDGKIVPLFWMHSHGDPAQIIGNGLLKMSPDGKGLDVYGAFNTTPNGKIVKEAVAHGDIRRLSIWANNLNRDANNNFHTSDIKEISLVVGSADPTAEIKQTYIAHSDIDENGDEYEYGEIWPDQEFSNIPGEIEFVAHSDTEDEKIKKGEVKVANTEDTKDTENKNGDGKTIEEVFNTLNEEQKNMVYQLVDKALKSKGEQDDEDDEDDTEDDVKHYDEGDYNMKKNVFDGANENAEQDYISHSDQKDILSNAKKPGMTFQGALSDYLDDFNIAHADGADVVAGFDDTKKVFDNKTSLNLMFPDFVEANGNMPELITSDQGWITTVLAKVKKAPFSRVRTSQVDIRNIDDIRAKGYQKGNKKAVTGNYALIRRTTDPQTVYVRSSLNRDDIVDITDFDYVQYQYNIDKLMLNEEVATAIMLGDGREDDVPDKIFPSHIRPIWTDDELYVKHVTVDIAAAKKALQGTNTNAYFGDNYIYAEAIIEALLHAREQDFRGTGTPDFYCTPALMNKMLLARDMNGRRIYTSKAELQSALNIGQMITAEQFTGRVRTDEKAKKHKLIGIVGNLADYQVGSTKGGEITHFNQFDIDFNQEKSLIETRLSGAVTRIYSFIVLEEDVADASNPATTG